MEGTTETKDNSINDLKLQKNEVSKSAEDEEGVINSKNNEIVTEKSENVEESSKSIILLNKFLK